MYVPEIEVSSLLAALANGETLIDVRETEEFEQARISGARLISLSEIPERIGEIPHQKRVHVICAKGGRSQVAVEFLRSNGIDAVNVSGGMAAWVEAGITGESGEVL